MQSCMAEPCRGLACEAQSFCPLHGDPARASELGRMGGLQNRHYVETEEVTIALPATPEDVGSKTRADNG